MDEIETEIILTLGSGPKTVWWISSLYWNQGESPRVLQGVENLIQKGFVEERGIEYLYPQTDRRDGVRRKRGKRLKTWTETRKYYALTDVGRVLLPLDSMRIGVI